MGAERRMDRAVITPYERTMILKRGTVTSKHVQLYANEAHKPRKTKLADCPNQADAVRQCHQTYPLLLKSLYCSKPEGTKRAQWDVACSRLLSDFLKVTISINTFRHIRAEAGLREFERKSPKRPLGPPVVVEASGAYSETAGLPGEVEKILEELEPGHWTIVNVDNVKWFLTRLQTHGEVDKDMRVASRIACITYEK